MFPNTWHSWFQGKSCLYTLLECDKKILLVGEQSCQLKYMYNQVPSLDISLAERYTHLVLNWLFQCTHGWIEQAINCRFHTKHGYLSATVAGTLAQCGIIWSLHTINLNCLLPGIATMLNVNSDIMTSILIQRHLLSFSAPPPKPQSYNIMILCIQPLLVGEGQGYYLFLYQIVGEANTISQP